MELEIIKQNENTLFKRKEIQFSLEAETTPSEKEMIDLISEKFSTKAENISMKGIHGGFGSNTFTINANIYDSPEEKQAVENKKKKGAEAKSEEKPAEGGEAHAPVEAPAEQPAEKPVEEKPAEEPAQEDKPAEKAE